MELSYVLLFLSFVLQIVADRWMSIAMLGSTIKSERSCSHLKGLNTKQVRVCRRHVELMDSVKEGAAMAIKECQHQFRYRKWNCTTVNKENEPVFGNALNKGTREAAFVYAIAAACVSFSVAKACTYGDLESCSCDRSLRRRHKDRKWQWAGCSDNVKFGTSFSRTFLDAKVRERHFSRSRILMNLHNNEVGRNVLVHKMVRTCKCHGVCGTCGIKTCWRRLPQIRHVAKKLKEKFNGASLVKEVVTRGRRVLLPRHADFKPPTPTDLVYLHPSPNFCSANHDSGSLGTTGRLCKKSSRAIDGCELLCCGRGYTTQQVTVHEKCNCKFHWCCFVQCDKCTKVIEVSRCR